MGFYNIGVVHHTRGVGGILYPMTDLHHPLPPPLLGCLQGQAAVQGMAAVDLVLVIHLG